MYILIQVGKEKETDNTGLGSDAINDQIASELLKEHLFLFQP